MKPETLYESLHYVDGKTLASTEKGDAPVRRRPWWAGAVAAVLVAAVALGAFWPGTTTPVTMEAHAIVVAQPPAAAQRPLGEGSASQVPSPSAEPLDGSAETLGQGEANQSGGSTGSEGDQEADAQSGAQEELPPREALDQYSQSLAPFFRQSVSTFLFGAGDDNRACSPVNVYTALAMLAETSGGDSRQQILDLLGSGSIQELRDQAHTLWETQYHDDEYYACKLASSLWLNQEVEYVPETMELLAENYYTSSYQGAMGSAEMNALLQEWLSQQTDGLLEEPAQEIQLEEDDTLAAAATLTFHAKWSDAFRPENNAIQVFHAPAGDQELEFLRAQREGVCYWGENFRAVSLGLANRAGEVWFLLPDEGLTPEMLLQDQEAMDFLACSPSMEWENQESARIRFAMPKVDFTSQMDLSQGLLDMGVTDVFSPARADFSPAMKTQPEGTCLAQVSHDVRIVMDEEGVSAAAFTVMEMTGSAAPPEKEIDFVLDRPFLFCIKSGDGLPLFAGIVNQPIDG